MREMRLVPWMLAVAAWVGCPIGCSPRPSPHAEGSVVGSGGKAAIPTFSTAAGEKVAAAGDTLRYDFGLVKPGEKVSHRFEIPNKGSKTWTFQRFHVNCTCTVGEASAPAIAPGKSEYVDVIFTAPKAHQDYVQKVGVQFAEDEAPFLSLEVSARVRDPICVLPPQMAFNRIGHGRTVEGTFEIYNYEDQDIEIGAITPSEPWVTVKSRAAFRGGAKPDPRQVWRVVVQAKTAGLSPGRHRCEVAIRADGAKTSPKPFELEVVLASPVEAIPERIFFGHLERGKPSEGRVLLRTSDDVKFSTPEAIVLKHDLGDQLRLSCTRGQSNYWELVATLTPAPGAPTMIRGQIDVRFTEGDLPSLTIPLMARVSEP